MFSRTGKFIPRMTQQDIEEYIHSVAIYQNHSQLSRTWKNRYRPILPGLFYIELRRAFVGKLS